MQLVATLSRVSTYCIKRWGDRFGRLVTDERCTTVKTRRANDRNFVASVAEHCLRYRYAHYLANSTPFVLFVSLSLAGETARDVPLCATTTASAMLAFRRIVLREILANIDRLGDFRFR